MSTEAYFEKDGVKKKVTAKRAKLLGFGKYGYTCCGHATIFGRKLECSANLLLVDADPPYFRETMMNNHKQHIPGCDHENTNEVEYSNERRYMNRLQPVVSLQNLHGILVDNDRNTDEHDEQNRNDKKTDGPRSRKGEGHDAEIRDVPPKKIMDFFMTLMAGVYQGDENDFLYLNNIEEYRTGAMRLRGEKIAMCRRYSGFDSEIVDALETNGLRKDNTFWFQDPFKGRNHVIMILRFDRNRIDEFQYTKNHDIFVDYKRGVQIVDKNGDPKLNGPYYVVYADWQSHVITTSNGLIQVAIGSFLSRKQVMHFGNDDLAVIKDNLERYYN